MALLTVILQKERFFGIDLPFLPGRDSFCFFDCFLCVRFHLVARGFRLLGEGEGFVIPAWAGMRLEFLGNY